MSGGVTAPKQSHTPGPWYQDGLAIVGEVDDVCPEFGFVYGGKVVCSLDGTNPMVMANAELIAAAPENARKAALWDEAEPLLRDLVSDFPDDWPEARALLARIDGESA